MNVLRPVLMAFLVSTTALAQDALSRLPGQPGMLEAGKAGSVNNGLGVALPYGIAATEDELPVTALSQIASHTVGEDFERTRSAKDIEIYGKR